VRRGRSEGSKKKVSNMSNRFNPSWGAMAVAIAEKGCYLHGLTLSEEQFHYTRNLVREKNLHKFATIELVDYRAHADAVRNGNGRLYDRIVSIEMLEAVGHDYLGAFFSSCDKLLAPNGLMFTQVKGCSVVTTHSHSLFFYR
jgi:cyclopropane-fatty-acyl-phospholipid synthase